MRPAIFLLCLATATWAGAQEPQPPKEAVRKTDPRIRAKAAEAKGDYAQAAQEYEKASAETAGRPQASRFQTEAVLYQARALENAAAADPAEAEKLGSARAAYERVVAVGEPDQKLAAQNALGVMLLKGGESQAALAQFQQMDLRSLPPREAFAFRSNLARAYELNGQPDRALPEYRRVLEVQPTFAAAREGAVRILANRRPVAVREALDLAAMLSQRDQPRAAADATRALVVSWSGQPESRQLLPALANAYVDARTDRAEFEKAEWPELSAALQGPSGPALRQLQLAWSSQLPVVQHRGEALQLFSEWSGADARPSMGRLLRHVSSREDIQGRYESALAHAWASWLVDARETAGALATAGLLQARPQLVSQYPFVLERLVDSLFSEKGTAYAQADWPRILNLHVVLAGLFEQQGAWTGGPRSALFQWEHAVDADREARREDPAMGPSPGVHRSLARCYQRLDRPQDAHREYLEAAEGFVAGRHIEEARAALSEARALGLPLDGPTASRVERLQAKVGQAPNP